MVMIFGRRRRTVPSAWAATMSSRLRIALAKPAVEGVVDVNHHHNARLHRQPDDGEQAPQTGAESR